MGHMAYDNENAFEGKNNQIEKYGAIFIDEVQDYLTPWLKILNKYFLEEHGEFVVFGDPKQNVYRRDLDSHGDIRIEFISGIWNHELKNGKRFANSQLALLAKDFQKTFFTANASIDDFGEAQIIQGSFLSKIMYGNIGRTIDTQKLANYCNKIITRYKLRAEETVVLSQAGDILRDIDFNYRQITGQPTITTFISSEEYDNLLRIHKLEHEENPIANYMFKRDKDAIEHNKRIHFTMETDGLKMSTIHSYKGWESPNVILFLEPELQEREKYCVSARENVPELIYTAITRAKDNIYIINLGNEKYHLFFDDHKN
jgi:superfamily I DNA/RNA helicase